MKCSVAIATRCSAWTCSEDYVGARHACESSCSRLSTKRAMLARTSVAQPQANLGVKHVCETTRSRLSRNVAKWQVMLALSFLDRKESGQKLGIKACFANASGICFAFALSLHISSSCFVGSPANLAVLPSHPASVICRKALTASIAAAACWYLYGEPQFSCPIPWQLSCRLQW